MVEDQLDNSITKYECISWLSIGVPLWTFGPFLCVVATRILNQIHFSQRNNTLATFSWSLKEIFQNEMQKKAFKSHFHT